MAMPKGFKSENGYGTSKLFDGMTYHEIADSMRESGYKMNHSTARNVFVNALIKVADEIVDLYDLNLTEKELKRLAINPDFQDSVRGFMSDLKIMDPNKSLFLDLNFRTALLESLDWDETQFNSLLLYLQDVITSTVMNPQDFLESIKKDYGESTYRLIKKMFLKHI